MGWSSTVSTLPSYTGVPMAVEISDEDFYFFLATFEQLMSPVSDDDDIIEALKLQNEIYRRLLTYDADHETPQESIQSTPDPDEARPSPVPPLTQSAPKSQTSLPPPTPWPESH